jgi:hypothetical protein
MEAWWIEHRFDCGTLFEISLFFRCCSQFSMVYMISVKTLLALVTLPCIGHSHSTRFPGDKID